MSGDPLTPQQRARRAYADRQRALGRKQVNMWLDSEERRIAEQAVARHRGRPLASPRLCPKCAAKERPEGRELPAGLAARLAGWPGVRYRDPRGCGSCRAAGSSAPPPGYTDAPTDDWDDMMWRLVALGEVDPFDALAAGVSSATAPEEPPASALALVPPAP